MWLFFKSPGFRKIGVAEAGETAASNGEDGTQAASAIALLQSKSLPMLVQEDIIARIANGALEAGDKLSENAVASRLGVSRGPVREAFRTLERAGLLQFERNRGVTVRRITVREASEIFELRAALDAFACRLAADCITDAQIERLSRLIDSMQEAADRNDVGGYLPVNLTFHDAIIEIAGNSRLAEVYGDLVNQILLFRRRTLSEGRGPAAANDEHRVILDGLKRRDPDAAAAAIRDHVLSARDRMLKVVSGAN